MTVLDQVAVRSWWTLHLPDRPALWCPDATRINAGGPPFRAIPLPREEHVLFGQLNDARTLRLAAARAGVPELTAEALGERLTVPELQALRLLPAPPGPRYLGARILRGSRAAHARADGHRDATGSTTLTGYHQHQITDGATHFDDRETTVAHAFAVGHPALGGVAFGARLWDALASRGLASPGQRIVEVGAGTGELARSVLDCGADPCDYLRVDLSPVLLETQAARCPQTRGKCADATTLALPIGSVDLVLCNEVIADLAAVPWSPGEAGEVGAWVARCGLEVLVERGPYNLGAWQLVERIAGWLAPGGAAYLSEFGALDEVPTETRYLDHPEVSIHFGHLAAVARSCGLGVEVLELATLLRADLHARWLSRPSYSALRALHGAHGSHLAARAWTAASVPTPERVLGLRDVPVSQDGPGPVITRFQVLLLTR